MTIRMGYSDLTALYDYWVKTGLEQKIPYFFPVPFEKWRDCFVDDRLEDVKKFSTLHLYTSVNEKNEINGFIQFGTPAFAWNKEGQKYPDPSLLVVRHLLFDPTVPEVGEELIQIALQEKEKYDETSGFFHIFGMSCNAHHGKLYGGMEHVHSLLLNKGFQINHENVYYKLDFEHLNETNNPLLVINERNNDKDDKSVFFEAFLQDQLIGTAEVNIIDTKSPDTVYLRWIGINEEYQGNKYGASFLCSIIRSMGHKGYKQIHTDTPINNIRAQKYYESLKFLNCGITRDYVLPKGDHSFD